MFAPCGAGKRLLTLVRLLVLFDIFLRAFAETVHFTNSASQLERTLRTPSTGFPKTYQLDVPGSRPITIIEAERVSVNRAFRQKKSGYDEYDRKTKDYIVPGSTHETTNPESSRRMYEKESSEDVDKTRCFGPSCNDPGSIKKTVYSPDLLNKFLKEYAEKIKNADENTKEKLQQLEETSLTHQGLFVTDKSFQKKKITDKIDLQVQDDDRKLSSWDQVDPKRQKHPFDDHEGWVALEAVPWTKSKISKWQSNTHKLIKPSNSYGSYGGDRDPYNNDRFSSVYGKPDTDRFSTGAYGKPDTDSDYDMRPQSNPQASLKPDSYNHRPTYSLSQADNDWAAESPSRPTWAKPQGYKPFIQQTTDWGPDPVRKPQRPDCDHPDHNDQTHGYDDNNRRVSAAQYNNDGIITDGQPGDFPTSALSNRLNGHYRKPTQVVYADVSNHPSSHPVNGDGQWVLLSTTKGYQFPKSRQRSLSVLAPSSLMSHRSVRLTVLPAVDGSKKNMTTSHGGLLEVDPNFQSVDDSRKLLESKQKQNGTRAKRTRIKKIIATDASPDSSAVMAAVGAGLVPATMAMIMPMVLGRKKRSPITFNPFLIPNYQNVTQQPHLDYESTLQRTL